jgi:hypothetical protein
LGRQRLWGAAFRPRRARRGLKAPPYNSRADQSIELRFSRHQFQHAWSAVRFCSERKKRGRAQDALERSSGGPGVPCPVCQPGDGRPTMPDRWESLVSSVASRFMMREGNHPSRLEPIVLQNALPGESPCGRARTRSSRRPDRLLGCLVQRLRPDASRAVLVRKVVQQIAVGRPPRCIIEGLPE